MHGRVHLNQGCYGPGASGTADTFMISLPEYLDAREREEEEYEQAEAREKRRGKARSKMVRASRPMGTARYRFQHVVPTIPVSPRFDHLQLAGFVYDIRNHTWLESPALRGAVDDYCTYNSFPRGTARVDRRSPRIGVCTGARSRRGLPIIVAD